MKDRQYLKAEYRNTEIHYTKEGHGKVIVLLHGYMSSSAIWTDFTDACLRDYCVINIDLPGHGASQLFPFLPEFSDYTEGIVTILQQEHIDNAYFISHSLGGYIALSILKHYSELVKGICLFHSHPFCDNDEKRALREKEAEMIKNKKKALMIKLNIHRSFYRRNQSNNEYIDRVSKIARETKDTGCIAALHAMRTRESTEIVLQNTNIPVLLIYGKHDCYLKYELLDSLVLKNGTKLYLENTAHYGFWEEKDICLTYLKRHLQTYYAKG